MLSSEMPINKPVVVTNEDYIHVVATRTDAENIVVVYREPGTWDIVLDMHLRVDGSSSQVRYLDRVFWSVAIEGRPATEQDFQDISRKSGLRFELDPKKREIRVSVQR